MSEASPFAAAVDHANLWIANVATALADDDRHHAWSALRAVLQVLRDHLPHEATAHFAAQLPLIVRGAFYEGWRPSETPVRERDPETFLGEIAARIGAWRTRSDIDPERLLGAVLVALGRCGMGGELGQAQRQLPKPIQELWQSSLAAAEAIPET